MKQLNFSRQLIALLIFITAATTQANAQYRTRLVKTGNVNSVFTAPNVNQHVAGKATNATITANYPSPSGPYQAFLPSEKAAIEYAVNLWRGILTSSVPIVIDFYKDASMTASNLAQGTANGFFFKFWEF